jgi:hypothetical protein
MHMRLGALHNEFMYIITFWDLSTMYDIYIYIYIYIYAKVLRTLYTHVRIACMCVLYAYACTVVSTCVRDAML